MDDDRFTDVHAPVTTASPPVIDNHQQDTSVYFDDLPEPENRRTRGRPGLLTSILVLVLVAGLGFYAGVRLEKRESGSGGGLPDGFGALAGGRGALGGAPDGAQLPGAVGGGGTTTGTVRLVDGDTIYVTTQSGEIVKVTTNDSTSVTRTTEATVGDVRPGDSVTVTGASGDDGTVTAQRIEDDGPSGDTGGGGPSPEDFAGLDGLPRPPGGRR